LENWFNIHAHTDVSNFRLRDCINKVDTLLDYALEIGLSGICLTDHEAISNHVKASKYIAANPEKFKDFTLGFGNEIYLVDREETLAKKEANERIEFYHFILLAKNQRGHEALKKLSSQAWENNFFYRGMERVPTYKDELEKIMEEYKGDLIASSACLGGELPKKIMKYSEEKTEENKKEIHDYVTWLKKVFGEDLYFELQPSHNVEQNIVNGMLLNIGKAYDVKCIVSTDAHYLNKDQAKAHEIYLKASEGEREVAAFYSTTYVMSYEELLDFFDKDVLDVLTTNTNEIKNKMSPISFKQEVKVPTAHIPDFKLDDLFAPHYEKYEFIRKFSESEYTIDKYYLHLIAKGMRDKNQELNEENLERINTELNEVYYISNDMDQQLASYFVLTRELIQIMWKVSLVGVARGSASCFYTNYLLDIVQINPIKYNLPHWRFLSKERPELPDIDIDSESSKRLEIIELVKKEYGNENVLNMGTFNTEAARSTILTACRGLGVDRDISQNISSLLPTQKGGTWTLSEAFYGDEEQGKKPAYEFINAIEKQEGLKETMDAIEGIVSGRGQHASGLIVFPNGYIEQNAMMKTTKGLPVTQFDAGDSEYMGGLKLDFLSVSALDRIRTAMDSLIEHGKIEEQWTLKDTYDKYFHPDTLEMEASTMFEMLYKGDVINAFQMETPVGQQTITKLKANTFDELSAANTLMRLSCEGEQPLDKFIRHKNDIHSWYKEMYEYGLNEQEVKIMENHALDTYGVTDSQEALMLLTMDEKISGYSLTMANKFRKAIAKQDDKALAIQKELFYKCGEEAGTRQILLDYVWKTQFTPSFGYAFSKPHVVGYTMILMIEMNICYKYGPIFWKTACLSVNAGLFGDKSSNTDYGSVAKAVGDMKGLIMNPDINLSKLGFTPLEKENRILFGLKPIAGLGVDSIEKIIEARPFTDFGDFYRKMSETGILSEKKVVTLIKAGCFDAFEPDRKRLMTMYVIKITPKKDKLTMAQIPQMAWYADQEKYKKELGLYDFKQGYFGKRKEFTKEHEKFFIEHLSKKIEYTFENDKLKIAKKDFDKVYEAEMEPLKSWLNSEDVINKFNKMKMSSFWRLNCSGTVESWEMETTLFYSQKHELDYIPLNKIFTIASFKKLSPIPIINSYGKYKGREYPIHQISVIAGTVVEKNKAKRLIHVLTQDGVVTIKFSKGQFGHYDEKIVTVKDGEKVVLDESWFARGTKLVLIGYRNGEQFTLKKTGTSYKHTVMRINGFDTENVFLQATKTEG